MKRRAGTLGLRAGAALALALAAAPGARAQLDPDRLPTVPQMPVLPGAPAAAPAPVVPDTVTAPVVLLAGGTPPRQLAVEPDSVRFGGQVWVIAAAQGAAAADSLGLPAWLEPVPAERAGRPPRSGDGVVAVPVRVYRVDPFRLQAGDATSNLVTVRGRTPDGAQTAPVRDPRRPGWNALVIAAILAALALAAFLAARLRLRAPQPLEHRPVGGAAWPALAHALEPRLAALAAGGDAKSFLDDLAALARGYAAERFGFAAREMTGDEIAAACRRLGYAPATGRAFGRLITELDVRRYDPAAWGEAWCRDRVADLLGAVDAVRLPVDDVAVAAEAAACWDRLVRVAGGRGGEAA
ncbi:MAG TPA: hypothetical protein PLQ13_08745 [Candidatus Krumholzibacteria bacterium]|nr:hypothetical protein [Candidatus Krumholzibacteria bacterium]